MNAKLVVGILLLVSILLAVPAQAPKVVVVYDKDAGTAQSDDDTNVQEQMAVPDGAVQVVTMWKILDDETI